MHPFPSDAASATAAGERPPRRGIALAAAAAGVIAIGLLDYVTGVELRLLPLYFVPLSVAAWEVGRRWTVVVALLCSAAWIGSNVSAGLHFSSGWLATANSLSQTTAFVVVGDLMARLRNALLRERNLSHTDLLTGLANRRGFLAAATRLLAIARRRGFAIGIAYIDVDDFKSVNDSHGHAGGDDVLREVARILDEATRTEDLKGRLGGDEFAVVAMGAGPAAARLLLHRLQETFAKRLTGTTVSIGATVFEVAPESVDAMLHAADALMYDAKAAGKNAFRLRVDGPPHSSAG